MACLYKRGKWYWVSYYVNGKQIKKSLHTKNERVARSKVKQIEYELSIGELQGGGDAEWSAKPALRSWSGCVMPGPCPSQN